MKKGYPPKREDNTSHSRMGVTVYQGSPTITPHTFTIRGWRAERSDYYCISVSQEGGSLRNWTRFFNSFTLFSPTHSLISSESLAGRVVSCLALRSISASDVNHERLSNAGRLLFPGLPSVTLLYRMSKVALNSKPVVFRFRI